MFKPKKNVGILNADYQNRQIAGRLEQHNLSALSPCAPMQLCDEAKTYNYLLNYWNENRNLNKEKFLIGLKTDSVVLRWFCGFC